jgi:hypothetical protein
MDIELAGHRFGVDSMSQPQELRCVHPLLTLLEKNDDLHRRVPNAKAEPATFIRHYEDPARTIAAASRLPPPNN